mmetsp:Transcript_82588/g.164751  ORF Transcript_82588/g.164751 Transcript_82588/m.164751 type:complete len:204 (-) Transcript_82588:2067-2678(-)
MLVTMPLLRVTHNMIQNSGGVRREVAHAASGGAAGATGARFGGHRLWRRRKRPARRLEDHASAPLSPRSRKFRQDGRATAVNTDCHGRGGKQCFQRRRRHCFCCCCYCCSISLVPCQGVRTKPGARWCSREARRLIRGCEKFSRKSRSFRQDRTCHSCQKRPVAPLRAFGHVRADRATCQGRSRCRHLIRSPPRRTPLCRNSH